MTADIDINVNPTAYFYHKLPDYMKRNGPVIHIKTAFMELTGRDAGVRMKLYTPRFGEINMAHMIHALRRLEKEGKVMYDGRGRWKWAGNSKNNAEA